MSFTSVLLIVSGLVAIIALTTYAFVPVTKVRVPTIVLSTLGGLGTGVALGMVLMIFYGDSLQTSVASESSSAERLAEALKNPTGPPMPGGGGGGGGQRAGGTPKVAGGAGGGGGMGRAPSPKNQLATLVTKLDQLTNKSLVLELTAEQKTKVRELLRGLGEMKDLSADEAKSRLDAILEVVKAQRETLEAAGYRWPGAGGGFAIAQEVPNPFAQGKTRDHLDLLQGSLGKENAKP